MKTKVFLVMRNAGSMSVLLFCLVFSKFVKLLKNKNNKKIWLISERPDEARDNGYHFFKYLRTKYPDISAYYVIDRESNDLANIAMFDNVITWGSFKHYQYWCMADCLVSAHVGKCSPEKKISGPLLKIGFISPVTVFLQHGVTAINCAEFMLRKHAHYDLLCAAAAPERRFLIDYAEHPEDVVALLGFCRFDALHNLPPVKRQILLMPTWRRWFRDLITDNGKETAMQVFKDSDYFRAFNDLLHSRGLANLLEEKGYQLVFYPHHGTQEYLEAFGRVNERIIIADRYRYDVQQLLKESAVLITDFSSVSFDFAYMGKPIVYYLPDEERYFDEHFQRGFFDFERDGFGPAVRDEEAVIERLQVILENESVMADSYKRRVDTFFPLQDSNNCERTFNAIHDLVNKRSR